MKQSKYLFPSEEKAREMKESLVSTEENPCSHTAHGLKAETIEKEIDGETVKDPTGKWQLDVDWCFSEDEEIDHPYGWKMYALELKREGNHGILGRSYLKEKL